jgi:hypothetical protein
VIECSPAGITRIWRRRLEFLNRREASKRTLLQRQAEDGQVLLESGSRIGLLFKKVSPAQFKEGLDFGLFENPNAPSSTSCTLQPAACLLGPGRLDS